MAKKQEFIPINFNNYGELKEIKVTTSVIIEDGNNLKDIISRLPEHVQLEEMIFRVEHGYYDEVDYILEYTDYEFPLIHEQRVLKFNYEVVQYNEWCEKYKIKFEEANESKRSRILSDKHRKEHYLMQLFNGEK